MRVYAIQITIETDGSTICPPGQCPLVDIKPAPGLVVIPKRIGTVSVMAAVLLSVIAGECPHGGRVEQIPFYEIPLS